MPTPTKPSIVFAHGLWADGSCFSKLITKLQSDGHEVISTQNSLDSLQGDVAAVKRALGRVRSPAILVGHSYAGTVITAAGMDDRVAGLVYIAAFAPDENETSQSLQSKFPTTEVMQHLEIADGRIWLTREGVKYFAGDLSESEQRLVWATQGAPTPDLFDQRVAGTAWRVKPSWYVVAKNDRTIQPELERFCAKRMSATTYEANTSHVPMLSNPGIVLDAIRDAAKALQRSIAAPVQPEPRTWH
jgi:pimeloyl-ACP methyl ester carboxylesterase